MIDKDTLDRDRPLPMPNDTNTCCTDKAYAMNIMRKWENVAGMVCDCLTATGLSDRYGCREVELLLDGTDFAIVLHQTDSGRPLWYNRTIREFLGIPVHEFGEGRLQDLLLGMPHDAMMATQNFMRWLRSAHERMCRMQLSWPDHAGNERHWYICSGRLGGMNTGEVILTIAFDVDLLLTNESSTGAGLSEVGNGPRKAFLSLSVREREVLGYLIKGHKSTFIAQSLHISEHTVQTHRRNIFRKLGVSTPLGLAIYLSFFSHTDRSDAA